MAVWELGDIQVKCIDPFFEGDEFLWREVSAKITYLGPQFKPIDTVVFSTLKDHIPIRGFLQLQENNSVYGNDWGLMKGNGHDPYYVDSGEIGRMLSRAVPALSLPKHDNKPKHDKRSALLSFSVIRRSSAGFEGFEMLIWDDGIDPFYEALIAGMYKDNIELGSALTNQARHITRRPIGRW
ncbi:MAG: hypothetical protein ACJ8FY_01635 [Gemmataceae bacterium]